MTAFVPTDEQAAARNAFAAGTSFVLQAGAGTGKTATLKLLAESAPARKGLYVAFNTAIAAEARTKFPNNVTVKTVHALAMRGTNFAFRDRLNKPRVPLPIAANRLGIFGDLEVGQNRRIRPTTQAAIAMQTVRRFCNSDDGKLRKAHVPRQNGLDPAQQKAVAKHILPFAQKVWDDVSSPISDNFRFEHDHYLKVWALTRPHWQADFVLYDEAQDANPVVSGMVADQLKAGRQLVAVGDSAQSIYGWRGAVDAMGTFDVPLTLPLTRSFRFGESVADEANLWLELMGSPMRLTGRADLDSRVVTTMATPDAVLCRTNGAAIGELFAALEADVNVGVVGGGKDLEALARAAADLKDGRPINHEELALFESWADVCDYADSGDDPHLTTLVNVVESHGPDAIVDAIQRAASEQEADRTISTLHKAKGREWARVRLAPDFAVPVKDQDGRLRLPAKDELMVAYVAVTRAMLRLDPGRLDWAREWLGGPVVDLAPDDGALAPGPTPTPAETPAGPGRQAATLRQDKEEEGAPWTRALDQALLSQYDAGTPLVQLVATFGRSSDAVASRLRTLRPGRRGALFAADGRPLHAPRTDAPTPNESHR